jgi:hypothetical protein
MKQSGAVLVRRSATWSERLQWKPTLKHLEVCHISILGVDIELDLGHGHIHVDAVKDLTESGAGIVLDSVVVGRRVRIGA